jgi:hypothetical protein
VSGEDIPPPPPAPVAPEEPLLKKVPATVAKTPIAKKDSVK